MIFVFVTIVSVFALWRWTIYYYPERGCPKLPDLEDPKWEFSWPLAGLPNFTHADTQIRIESDYTLTVPGVLGYLYVGRRTWSRIMKAYKKRQNKAFKKKLFKRLSDHT